MFYTTLKVFVINLILTKLSFQLSCLDEKGSPLDWYIVYKLPKLTKSSIETVKSGYGYAFITDNSIKLINDWTLSSIGINDKTSMFGQTISPLLAVIKQWTPNGDLSYVVYNDQSPRSTSSSSAHAKGVFAVDSKSGFWLTHSVPKFPNLRKGYNFPDNAIPNGQTAICISLDPNDIKSLNNIAINLLIMRPNVYGIKIQNLLSDKSKFFTDLKNENWIKNESYIESIIKSKNGLEFTSFSKSNKYSKDIYSGLIANYFKEDLLVQTWRNGAGDKLDSDCTDAYKVINIDKIRISNIMDVLTRSNARVDWNATEDHSKWVINSEATANKLMLYIICISDINRMKSQFKRGGGSLCLNSTKVWQIFKNSIESTEGCSLNPKIKSPKKPSKSSANEIYLWKTLTKSKHNLTYFQLLLHSNLFIILFLCITYLTINSFDRIIFLFSNTFV